MLALIPTKLYSDGYQNVNFDFGGPISDNVKVYLSIEAKEKAGDVSYSYFPKYDAMAMTEVPADYYSDGTDGFVYGNDANGNKVSHIETVVRRQPNRSSIVGFWCCSLRYNICCI